jgi:PDDEXK-like uncharacterized protein DUF3799
MHKTVYKDGIYNISNDEYHASVGYSRTQLMALDKSPYHFWYEHISGQATPKEPTEAMLLGSAFHTMLLQPDLFSKEYAVLPKLDRRKTADKEIYASFMAVNGDKQIVTWEQYDKIWSIKESILKHDIVNTLLKDTVYEQSLFWTDEETGLQFKARPDIWSSKMIVDLKTADDVNPHYFKNAAFKNGYYLQAGMMWEACRVLGKKFELFVILAIEKKEPYAPAVFMMRDEAIEFGLNLFHNYKKIIAKCLEYNKWEAYPIVELDVPRFALTNNEEI